MVKYPVAVANSDETIKRMAKFMILSNEENGVVCAIK